RYDTRRSVWAPATEHWDGRRWQFVSAPHATAGYNAFYGIGGSSAKDVWAVGYATPRYDQYTQAPLIEHWDGSAWSVVDDATATGGVLNGVVALSPDDTWAVGTSHDGGYGALIGHWRATGWSLLR